MGVGTFAETDVYAGARVFTGWNLRAARRNAYYTFTYIAGQHDTTAKEFTFPIYSERQQDDSGAVGDAGMQDGVDLIDAVAAASGDRPAAGAEAVSVLRQRGRRAGPGAHRRHRRISTIAAASRSSRCSSGCSCRRSSSTRRIDTTRVFVAGRSSSRDRIKEIGWAGSR